MDNNFYEWSEKAEKATEKGKVLKFDRYGKNLRYNSEGIYSYGTTVATLDLKERSIQRQGYWSSTSSTHYHYAMNMLGANYNFLVKPNPDFRIPPLVRGPIESLADDLVHVQHLSYDDHT